MNDISTKHHRRSIRLKRYDYTQPGAYFITICTHNRQCLFGEVVNGEMLLNALGKIVRDEWRRTTEIRPNVKLDAFVIMPNHIHGIIVIHAGPRRGTLQRAPTMERHVSTMERHVSTMEQHVPTIKQYATTTEQFGKPTSNSIPTIIRLFKSAVTKRINEIRGTPGIPVWQRNYYEHIVRNDGELNRIRKYIINNPLKWEFDHENPNARSSGPGSEAA